MVKGELLDRNGFILLSDGAMQGFYQMRNKIFSVAVNKLFNWIANYSVERTREIIQKNLENVIMLTTTDDCSIIVMHKENYPILYLPIFSNKIFQPVDTLSDKTMFGFKK